MSKNIVLLSDGTGNSSSKLFKTNVWRMFQTLDLEDATKQVAYYDNGVGTSSFKLFAVLGGVFGFGLKRNVIDIYSFCCRNYVAGDRIYGFGFSRGAFTMRVVAGLIAREGLVPYDGDEAALARYATDAYRDYRRRFTSIMWLVGVLRFLRDLCIKVHRLVWRIPLSVKRTDVPKIHFLGVWDTVDAYGGPIEEIVSAIDYWYWPLSMPDRFMNSKIHRACHALALEDERDAFKPVIWDERYVRSTDDGLLHDMREGWTPDVSEEVRATLKPIDDRRLSQVWFVGVHSDLGGGYPQDGLAYYCLDWMFDRAEAYGLRYNPVQLQQMRSMADRFDKLNDSRHGFAGYYRYKPRNLYEIYNTPPYKRSFFGDFDYMFGALINRDPDAKIVQKAVKKELAPGTEYHWQPVPIIHKAVFDRIVATNKPAPPSPPPRFNVATDGYVPIVLPPAYQVTDKDGNLSHANDPCDPADRYELQTHRIWNRVWLRRIVYFLTVLASLLLASVPLLDNPDWGADTPLVLLRPIIALAGAFLPSMLSPWLSAYSAAPGYFVLGIVVVGILLFLGGWLQGRIRDYERAIWIGRPKPRKWWEGLAYGFRTNALYRIFFFMLKHQWLPGFFALLGLWIILAFLNQMSFRIADGFGNYCVGGAPPATFDTTNFCAPTGVKVIRDDEYRVVLTVGEEWKDNTIATDPRGFGFKKMSVGMYLWLPFRRVVFSSWFVPVLRVGGKGGEEHVLDLKPVNPGDAKQYEARFRPRSDGEVFVFVNDAVIGWPGSRYHFYKNNHGTATIKIEHLNVSSRD
jgi:uncharacterized protein (DUF2235 family)